LVVNTAVTLLDLEETVHSPSRSPRVGSEPVVNVVLSSVSEELDGVTTEETTGDVLVNT